MKKKSIIILVCILTMLFTGCNVEKVKLPAQKEITSKNLKDVFLEHGMKVGTCVSANVKNDEKMSALILEQFNSVTMENAMKPDYILNQERSKTEGKLVVEFNQEALSVLGWAKNNGLSMRGHTLIWYSQTPEWIFHEGFDTKGAYVGRETMLARMESMISGVFEELDRLGYIDLFYAYDVINEAWMEDGTIRKNHWTETIGDDYLWYAFYYADKYAPESIDLYYNDYNFYYKGEKKNLGNYVSNVFLTSPNFHGPTNDR